MGAKWETGGASKGVNSEQGDLQPGLPVGCTGLATFFFFFGSGFVYSKLRT